MSEEKIVELLAQVVAQNEAILRQNREFMAFVQKRDAGLEERTRLEIEHLASIVRLEADDKDHIAHVYETLGVGRGDLIMLQVMRDIGFYDAGKKLRDRLEATGKLNKGSGQ